MGRGFRCENPVTSLKYLHINSRHQVLKLPQVEQNLTCYLQFADTVFENGKSNPPLPYPLKNVVPLIKLPQETVKMSTLVGRVEEGSYQFSHKIFR